MLEPDESLADRGVGTARSGRLVAADEGGLSDDDEELYATDVGIDGAAASAEEAAVHVVDESDVDGDRRPVMTRGSPVSAR